MTEPQQDPFESTEEGWGRLMNLEESGEPARLSIEINVIGWQNRYLFGNESFVLRMDLLNWC